MKFVLLKLTWASIAVCAMQVQADEILQHISDETAPVVVEPASLETNHRRIIYRVICSPGGEALPDCERPIQDAESVAQPVPEIIEQNIDEPFAPDSAQIAAEPVQPKKTAQSKKTRSKKTTSGKKKSASKKAKKTKSKKQTAKKTTSKKASSSKKKSQKR